MTAPVPPRVVLAEDSYLIREGLRALLADSSAVELVAVAASLAELLAAVAEQGPDVVITDIRMPPTHSDEGIRAAEQLARDHPDVGVVILSNYVEPEWAQRLFEPSSARRAYLLKERVGDLAQVLAAVRTVADGGTVLDPSVVDSLVRSGRRRASSPLATLTARESQILALVASGSSNTRIAADLVLAERTVEKHISSILAKLDLDPDDAATHRRVRAVLIYLAALGG